MSAVLKQTGIEVEVVPAEYERVKSYLVDRGPAILAFSTPTPYYGHYRELNQKLKRDFPHVFSVFGGPHPTFFPDMISDDGVDGICMGEGEHAMLELVTNLAQGKPVRDLRNWWIKEDGVVYKNPLRPLIEDLDGLPQPDHSIFRQAMSKAVNQAIVITGRGCPHNCSYCFNHAYKALYEGLGRMIRRRSVDHVLLELDQIKSAGYGFIRFMDDVFILSKDWIAEFSEKYPLRIGLPFSCLVRANFVTPEIVKALKRAGCYRILMGIEAGNDHLRNDILKRNMTKEAILNAARMIKAEGIKLVTANILAIPGGSYEADMETLDLNIRCRPDYASPALLQPYPRTWIYHYAESEGLIDTGQLAKIETSFGFGIRTDFKFKDRRDKRRMENLHKFFPLVVWHPWLLPVVKQLVKLPPNRIFDIIYYLSANYGIHFKEMPPRLGLPVLMRRVARALLPKRLSGDFATSCRRTG